MIQVDEHIFPNGLVETTQLRIFVTTTFLGLIWVGVGDFLDGLAMWKFIAIEPSFGIHSGYCSISIFSKRVLQSRMIFF